jgi:hypothetical protein
MTRFGHRRGLIKMIWRISIILFLLRENRGRRMILIVLLLLSFFFNHTVIQTVGYIAYNTTISPR